VERNITLTDGNDDLELWIDSTWVEGECDFGRVIVMGYMCSDMYQSDADSLERTVGPNLRRRIGEKLSTDLGIEHERDYIFGVYDNPVMRDGKWITAPQQGESRAIIRVKEDEHFTMLKLHYHVN